MKGLFWRLILWAFALTELPPIDEVCDNPDCRLCAAKRRKRKVAEQ